MGNLYSVVLAVLTAACVGIGPLQYSGEDVGFHASDSTDAGATRASSSDRASSGTALGRSEGAWRDDEFIDYRDRYAGVEVARPKSWETIERGVSRAFRPEGVEGAKLALWCEGHRGAEVGAMLSAIRDANARIAEDLREEGYAVVESEVKDMQVNGIQAQLVKYKAVAKDSSMIRGERIGYALPQRCVYYDWSCPAYLYDEHASLVEKTFANVRSPEIDGTETRYFVDEEDELRIETPDYSFDLPEYWLGRVDVAKGDNGSVGVFVAGDYARAIMGANVQPETLSYGGDISGGPFLVESMGDGRRILLNVVMYPCLVAQVLPNHEKGEAILDSMGVSDEVAQEATDLETGGALSLDDVLANPGAPMRDYFAAVRDYMDGSIAPTLVLHPSEGGGR